MKKFEVRKVLARSLENGTLPEKDCYGVYEAGSDHPITFGGDIEQEKFWCAELTRMYAEETI